MCPRITVVETQGRKRAAPSPRLSRRGLRALSICSSSISKGVSNMVGFEPKSDKGLTLQHHLPGMQGVAWLSISEHTCGGSQLPGMA